MSAPRIHSPQPIRNIEAPHEYPIRFDLEYRILQNSRILAKGTGYTITFSRNTVLFESEAALAVGKDVELTIAWPVRLERTVGLRLLIRGRTVDGNCNQTMVLIQRHEFRTRALHPAEPARPELKNFMIHKGAAGFLTT